MLRLKELVPLVGVAISFIAASFLLYAIASSLSSRLEHGCVPLPPSLSVHEPGCPPYVLCGGGGWRGRGLYTAHCRLKVYLWHHNIYVSCSNSLYFFCMLFLDTYRFQSQLMSCGLSLVSSAYSRSVTTTTWCAYLPRRTSTNRPLPFPDLSSWYAKQTAVEGHGSSCVRLDTPLIKTLSAHRRATWRCLQNYA